MEYRSDIEFVTEYCGSSIYIKRDDKIPFSFGGNKVRIAEELLDDLKKGGYTAVISYGSPGSNMNRAAAAAAKRENIKCYVIIKLDEADANAAKRFVPSNERLAAEAGAEIIYCTGNNVRECVENVTELSRSRGENPYYIYGDSTGKGNELKLMRASYKEYGEILEYERDSNLSFDHIVLTVGTAMTISGLAAAENENKRSAGHSRLVGISAARDAAKTEQIIRSNLKLMTGCETSAIPLVLDDYLCGGYGKYNKGIEDTIAEMLKDHGIPLDPTYTGKSFYGMLKEAESGRLGGRILFIHTGGYPIHMDYMSKVY